jgi:hypothetical protein
VCEPAVLQQSPHDAAGAAEGASSQSSPAMEPSPLRGGAAGSLEDTAAAREYRRLFESVVATLDLDSLGQPHSGTYAGLLHTPRPAHLCNQQSSTSLRLLERGHDSSLHQYSGSHPASTPAQGHHKGFLCVVALLRRALLQCSCLSDVIDGICCAACSA